MLRIAVCDDSRELLEKVEKDLLEYESARSTPVKFMHIPMLWNFLTGSKKQITTYLSSI